MTRILLKTAKRKTKVSRASVRNAISGLFRAKAGKIALKKTIAKKKTAPASKRKRTTLKK